MLRFFAPEFHFEFIVVVVGFLCGCDWVNFETMGACNNLQCSKY